MLSARFFVVGATLAVSTACGEPPSALPPVESDLLVNSADSGNGAIVSRTLDDTFILATGDPRSGLGTLHYASATNVATRIPGCVLPPFENGDRLNVQLPNGKMHDQAHFEVYVLVVPLVPGFPLNACGEPALAEGPIQIHVVFNSGSPGNGVFSTGSNGIITDSSDGSDVRLHHSLQGPLGTGEGTVRLR